MPLSVGAKLAVRSAESMIVHLSQASDSELTDFLNGQAERIGPEDWRYPNDTVSLCLYLSMLNECEPDDVQAISDGLGVRPATSLACFACGPELKSSPMRPFSIVIEFVNRSPSRSWVGSGLWA